MPCGFQIYSDPGVKPNDQKQIHTDKHEHEKSSRRYLADELLPKVRFAFDIWEMYPEGPDEMSFEEINLNKFEEERRHSAMKTRIIELEIENDNNKAKIENMTAQIEQLIQQIQLLQVQRSQQYEPENQLPNNSVTMDHTATLAHGGGGRLSIVPRSLQLVQADQANQDGPDISMTICNEGYSLIDNMFARTTAMKFTVPIDQSAYIKQNVPTSTPNNKQQRQEPKQSNNMINRRRSSRVDMGGSPTLKLSPITETSRDGNSKSSSSSSSGTPSTVKKARPKCIEVPSIEELNPNDPKTYMTLLSSFWESLETQPNFHSAPRSLPMMRNAASIQAGSDTYLIQKEIAPGIYSAQLLPSDDKSMNSNEDSSSMDIAFKTVVCRVDKPANVWLFYICSELHNRLTRLKTKPDIELSVMMTNPAIVYSDGSVLIDEYTKYITLQDYLDASKEAKRPFSKAVSAFIAIELIQIVRQMHRCDIVHLNIIPSNILLISCPSSDDIKNVAQQTTMVKLIGFGRAMDMRLVPPGFKFEGDLSGFPCRELLESRPWSFEADWIGTLNCIHQMFFNENLSVFKDVNGRWSMDKQLKNLPTDIWSTFYDQLLNVDDIGETETMIDSAVVELDAWVKANLSFVMKETMALEEMAEKFKKNLDETRS